MAKVTVTLEVDEQKLWEATFGSSPFSMAPWFSRCKFLDGADWDKRGRIELTIADPNDDATITKILDATDLVRAYEWLMNNPRYHCFGQRVAQDIEHFDSCEGDSMLQVAMLGQDYYS